MKEPFCANKTLASAYFPTQGYAVSWAMKRLTSEFGMGSGVPASLWTPRKFFKYIIDREKRGFFINKPHGLLVLVS